MPEFKVQSAAGLVKVERETREFVNDLIIASGRLWDLASTLGGFQEIGGET